MQIDLMEEITMQQIREVDKDKKPQVLVAANTQGEVGRRIEIKDTTARGINEKPQVKAATLTQGDVVIKGNNQDTTAKGLNEKPQVAEATSTQGNVEAVYNKKSTTARELKESKTRYEKGLELYKQGMVTIDSSGLFRVSGYLVDVEKVRCECPDYRKNKVPCAHFYAASLFQKKAKFNQSTKQPQNASNTQIEARGKPLDAKVGVRLSCLTLAVEVLKTYDKPISSKNLFKVATEIETWVMGGRL